MDAHGEEGSYEARHPSPRQAGGAGCPRRQEEADARRRGRVGSARAQDLALTLPARTAYDVWLLLIADEELYRATLTGKHRDLAGSRGLTSEHLTILDAFRAERGTRWNVENLRFRAALEVRATLLSYMPRTLRLLCKGDEAWEQEVCFEYLAFNRWQELGHFRLSECERFGEYTRDRIMKRRTPPRHLEAVLTFELGVVRALKRTATIGPDAWPAPWKPDDDELAGARIARGPAVEIIETPVDLGEWVRTGDPLVGEPRPQPATFLVYVPSLALPHRTKILSEGSKAVLEAFDGSRATAEIASSMEADYGIERGELFSLVRVWLNEGILALSR